MAVVAITMATGWHARWGAALLIAAGPLGMLEFGIWPVLQRIDLLGLAVYVLARRARPLVGRRRDRPRPPSRALIDHARGIWALKVAAGLALIIVAFAEKLATPDLAVQFLADHPDLNVAQQLGIDMSDLEFARVAGAIEVLFGLLLISRRAAAGDHPDRRHPVQRDAVVLRRQRADGPPADLRRDARDPRLRLRPAAAPRRLRPPAARPPRRWRQSTSAAAEATT